MLRYRDKVPRIQKLAGGEKRIYMINRLKCTNESCGKIHRQLTDGMVKFKHYCAETIEDVLDGVISEEDGLEQPCENTMKHWRWWFVYNKTLMEGQIRSAGIRRVFHIQREKFFPLPDYDITSKDKVVVSIYGKEINEKFTYLLHDNEDLNLVTVYLLDQVQKGKPISKEAAAHLRKHKLVEGRVNNLYLAAPLARTAEDRAQYIKNRAFDNQYYQDMIVNYLREFGKANKAAIRDLLIDKLPDTLSSSQKERKVLTLLTALKRKGIITTDSDNKQISQWILVKDNKDV